MQKLHHTYLTRDELVKTKFINGTKVNAIILVNDERVVTHKKQGYSYANIASVILHDENYVTAWSAVKDAARKAVSLAFPSGRLFGIAPLLMVRPGIAEVTAIVTIYTEGYNLKRNDNITINAAMSRYVDVFETEYIMADIKKALKQA